MHPSVSVTFVFSNRFQAVGLSRSLTPAARGRLIPIIFGPFNSFPTSVFEKRCQAERAFLIIFTKVSCESVFVKDYTDWDSKR